MSSFNSETRISIKLIKDFIYEAKLQAFAGSDNKTSMVNQCSVYSYRDFNSQKNVGLIYNDEYSGNTVEAGQETVSYNLCNVWRNQYYGGSFIPYWDGSTSKELSIESEVEIEYLPFITIEFLREALREIPKDFPVRGPEYYSIDQVCFDGKKYKAKWEYKNNWRKYNLFDSEDPFLAFQGEEYVLCNGIQIYWHGYHGGFLRDKYFPIALED